MAAAWNVAIDFEPPKVAVVLAKDSHTRALVCSAVRTESALRTAGTTVMQVGSVSVTIWQTINSPARA